MVIFFKYDCLVYKTNFYQFYVTEYKMSVNAEIVFLIEQDYIL